MSSTTVLIFFLDKPFEHYCELWHMQSDVLVIELPLIEKKPMVILLLSTQPSASSVSKRLSRTQLSRRHRRQFLRLAASFASGVLAAIATTLVDAVFSLFGIR